MEDQLDAKEMMEEKEIITDMENLIDMEYFRNRLAEPLFVAELRMENARKKRKALDIGVVPNECGSKGKDSAEAGTSSELKKKAGVCVNQLEILGEVCTVKLAELETPNVGIQYYEQQIEIEDESYSSEFVSTEFSDDEEMRKLYFGEGSVVSDTPAILSEDEVADDDVVARVQQWMDTTLLATFDNNST